MKVNTCGKGFIHDKTLQTKASNSSNSSNSPARRIKCNPLTFRPIKLFTYTHTHTSHTCQFTYTRAGNSLNGFLSESLGFFLRKNERFAHIAHQKRGNERIAQFLTNLT